MRLLINTDGCHGKASSPTKRVLHSRPNFPGCRLLPVCEEKRANEISRLDSPSRAHYTSDE